MPVRRLLISDIKELKFNIEKTKKKFKDMKLFDLRIRDMFGGLGSPPSGASSSKDHPLQDEKKLEDDNILSLLQEVMDDDEFLSSYDNSLIDKINNILKRDPKDFDSVEELLKAADTEEKLNIFKEEKKKERNKKRLLDLGLYNTELPTQDQENLFLKLFSTAPADSASLNKEESINGLHVEYGKLLHKLRSKDIQDVKKQNKSKQEELIFTNNKVYERVSLFSIRAKLLAETILTTLQTILSTDQLFGSVEPPEAAKTQLKMFLNVKDSAKKTRDYHREDQSRKKDKQELLNFRYNLRPISGLDTLPEEAMSIVKKFDEKLESNNRALVTKKTFFKLPNIVFKLLTPELAWNQFIPYKAHNTYSEKYQEIMRSMEKQKNEGKEIPLTAEQRATVKGYNHAFSPESRVHYRKVFTQSLEFLRQRIYWIQNSMNDIKRTHPVATNQAIFRSFIDNGVPYEDAIEYIRSGNFMTFALNKYQEGVQELAYVASNELKYRFYFIFLGESLSAIPAQYLLTAMLNPFFYAIHTAYKKIFPLIPNMSNGPPDIYDFFKDVLVPQIFDGKGEYPTRHGDFKDVDTSLGDILTKLRHKSNTYWEKNAMRMGDEFKGKADSVGLDEEEEKDYEEKSKLGKNKRGPDIRDRGKHKSIDAKLAEFNEVEDNIDEARKAILESANKAHKDLADILLDSDDEVEANLFEGDDLQGVDEDIKADLKALTKLLSDNKGGKETKKFKKMLEKSEEKLRAKLKTQYDKLEEDEKELHRLSKSLFSKIVDKETAIKYKANLRASKRKFAFDYNRKLRDYKNTLRAAASAALKLKQDKTAFETVSKRLVDTTERMRDIGKEIQSKKTLSKKALRREILKKYDTFYKLQDQVTDHVVKVQNLSKPNNKLTMNDLRKKIHNINELYVMPKVEKTQDQKDLEEALKAQKEKERKDKAAKAAKDRKDAKAARDAANAAQLLAPIRVPISGRITRSRAAQQGRGDGKGLLKLNVWMINKKLKR